MTGHYLQEELYGLMRTDDALFEFLQHSSLDGIWYWDLENPEHEWMSPRFWETLGYDPNEMRHLASEWQSLINPDDLKAAISNFEKHCQNPNHAYDQVVRYQHRDGSTVWVRCRGMAVRDSGGKPIRMLGAHIDLTAQKLAEQKLGEKIAELEAAYRALQVATSTIEKLEKILPICSCCHKIRRGAESQADWLPLGTYLREETGNLLSHGLCPECFEIEMRKIKT